jgi:hypothetical protein
MTPCRSVRRMRSVLALLVVLAVTVGASVTARAEFCTVAGGCAPVAKGELTVLFIGPEGAPIEADLAFVPAGAPAMAASVLGRGVAGTPVSLPAGAYDVWVDSRPLFREAGVIVAAGESRSVEIGGYGEVLVAGNDLAGAPMDVWVHAYTVELPPEGDGFAGTGYTNAPLGLLAGTYDIIVNTEPELVFEDIVVERGGMSEIALPSGGELVVRGLDSAGAPLDRWVFVYADFESDEVIAGADTNEVVPLLPGSYTVYVDLDPDFIFDDVVVESGRLTELEVAQMGSLVVEALDADGGPLEEDVYIYAPGEDDVLGGGDTDNPFDMPPGTYDVDVNLNPRVTIAGVTIEPGVSTRHAVVQRGRLLIEVEDADGAMLTESIYLYPPGETEDYAVFTYIGTPVDIEPGTYDAELILTPRVWIEGIEIESGESVIRSLDQQGRLFIDGGGEEIFLYVYRAGERDNEVELAYTDQAIELGAGRYDIEVTTDPRRWFEDVEIEPGEIQLLELD